MTAVVHYVQQPTQIFQFNVGLADLYGNVQSYNLAVTWNLYGQRYYLSCFTQQNALVFSVPLMNSPPDYSINLTAGYFSTPVVFRESTQNFEIG